MRSVENELAEPAVRALVGACAVDDGPTDEQRRIITALAHAYFGLDLDPATLDPLSPGRTADFFGDHDEKHRLVEMMIVLELSRHPASDDQARLVEAYADALGIDEPMQHLVRDYVADDRAAVAADFARFSAGTTTEPHFVGVDERAVPGDLRALESCPPGSLGRGFFDFYQRYDLRFPGEPGGGHVSLVAHDMSHVVAGYEPNPIDEIALQAMLTSACDGEQHFSSLVASLSLFEIGMLPFDNIEPKVAVLARPGAVEAFADAVRRGASCERDFATMDHWAVIDQPLDTLRRELNVVPRLA